MKKLSLILTSVSLLTSLAATAQTTPAANEQKVSDEPLIGRAGIIPVAPATGVISFSPVVLQAPGRSAKLQVKVTLPAGGTGKFPVIILSHGHGNSNYLSSLNGYAPLVNFWASHGFIVIQPTHLDSKSLAMNPRGPEGPFFWRSRAQDIKRILDQLDVIEKQVPGIKGRIDRERIAIAGHSLGGFTASMLLGEVITDAKGEQFDMGDPRIKAGVLLSAPGNGGADLNPTMARAFADYHPDFATLKKPALVIAGESDASTQETIKGWEWHIDPYKLSSGSKSLITLTGSEHNLGGISGYDAAEAKDENPERAALVERLTWAYLWAQLYPGDPAWQKAAAAFNELKDLGTLSSK